MYRNYVVPILGNDFTEITRYTQGSLANVEALANAAGDSKVWSDPSYIGCKTVSAAELLRDGYVVAQLAQNDGWYLFGRAFRMGSAGSVIDLHGYKGEVPLLKELLG